MHVDFKSWRYSSNGVAENRQPGKTGNFIHLPDEIIDRIFSYTDLATFLNACRVKKDWDRILKHKNSFWSKGLEIYFNKCFGRKQWSTCFGENVLKKENTELTSFTGQMLDELLSPAPNNPEKRCVDEYNIAWCPNETNAGEFTVVSLEDLIESNVRRPAIQNKLKTKLKKSKWVIVAKDVIPQLPNNHRVPKSIELALSRCAQYYFEKGKWDPKDFDISAFDKTLSCQEALNGGRVAICSLKYGMPFICEVRNANSVDGIAPLLKISTPKSKKVSEPSAAELSIFEPYCGFDCTLI